LKPGREMYLAYLEGEPAGCMGLDPGHPDGCDILKDPGTATIEIVYVLPEFRRCGVGLALLNFFLKRAQEQGYQRCAVEYESANVTAARFWERWFDPVCCSLLRRIDDRIIPEIRD
ncbi:MAG: GNAT family N-acetyltransferase, partial [Anaerolineales bacterium]